MAVALTTDPNKIGIRKFLTGQGYKDEEIGFDPTRKMVTLQGRDYTAATPGSDNYTYGTSQNLTGALNTFNQLKAREQRQGDIDGLVTRLKERTSQPARTFSYDPNADPSYQAALRTAETNAETGSNANLAEMNRRGILNSTITSDRGERIRQQELGRVTTEVLPQLQNQAYNRFVNEQNQEQSQFQNLASLLDYLTGRGDRDQDIQREDRRFAIDDERYTRETEYQTARDAIVDKRYQTEFDLDVKRYGLEQAADKAYKAGQLSLDRSRIVLQERELNIREKEAEARTKEENNQILVEESQGLTDILRAGEMTPAQALQQIDQDLALGFYTPEQAQELKRIVSTISPTLAASAQTELTDEQQTQTVTGKALDKIYNEQGQGKPKRDWQKWYNDSRGRLAGVNFDTWHRLYGPEIKAK